MPFSLGFQEKKGNDPPSIRLVVVSQVRLLNLRIQSVLMDPKNEILPDSNIVANTNSPDAG